MAMDYSLSDLATITKDGDGVFGGNGIGLLIIIFLLMGFGGNGNFYGNRNGEFSQYATAASQQEILFGQQFQNLGSMVNKIGDGLSSLGYAQLQQMDENTARINGNITNEGRNLQMQLANCCCENQRNVDSVRYDMSNFAAQINSNIDNKFAALEKAQLEQTIQAQQNQINQLALAQQMSGVVKYPMSSTYAMMNNPFCGGCGCSYAN